jgi:hypothetical protein
VNVKVRVVVDVPSLAVTVIVVVPLRPARGARRIERLEPLLSGNVTPELKIVLVFDSVADSVTADAPDSASPTVKLIVRAVLRGVVYDEFRPEIVGGVFTVTVCDAEVIPDAETVSVRLPADDARNRKLAVLDPFAIVTDVMFMPSVALRNEPVPECARFTTSEPVVRGVPPNDCRCTVMTPVDTFGVVTCGDVVKTNFGRPVMVTVCDADA